MKEIFFSGSVLAGKLPRRMMFYLSISVDEDVQQTLSFFQKVGIVMCKALLPVLIAQKTLWTFTKIFTCSVLCPLSLSNAFGVKRLFVHFTD